MKEAGHETVSRRFIEDGKPTLRRPTGERPPASGVWFMHSTDGSSRAHGGFHRACVTDIERNSDQTLHESCVPWDGCSALCLHCSLFDHGRLVALFDTAAPSSTVSCDGVSCSPSSLPASCLLAESRRAACSLAQPGTIAAHQGGLLLSRSSCGRGAGGTAHP